MEGLVCVRSNTKGEESSRCKPDRDQCEDLTRTGTRYRPPRAADREFRLYLAGFLAQEWSGWRLHGGRPPPAGRPPCFEAADIECLGTPQSNLFVNSGPLRLWSFELLPNSFTALPDMAEHFPKGSSWSSNGKALAKPLAEALPRPCPRTRPGFS